MENILLWQFVPFCCMCCHDDWCIICFVAVLIDSGSRYEVAHISGITHFLEKLAFGVRDNSSNSVGAHSTQF